MSNSLSSIHRVFISNLQKEIEKQTGYRSSRKRRSESQYDYEVYHSLEEVDVKPAVYLPAYLSLLSNLTHTHTHTHWVNKHPLQGALKLPITPFHRSLSHSPSLPLSHTQRHTLHFRHFTAVECLFSQVDQAPGSRFCQGLWSSVNSTHRPWEATQVFSALSFEPLLRCKTHTYTHTHTCTQTETQPCTKAHRLM